ncbi:MAG: hypothetical protein WBG86_19635 [Polyangiales bacterium]
MGELQRRILRLLQDPRVDRLLRDPRAQRAVMGALRARGRAQERVDLALERMASALHLATAKEIRQLKRTIRRLEEELARTNYDA